MITSKDPTWPFSQRQKRNCKLVQIPNLRWRNCCISSPASVFRPKSCQPWLLHQTFAGAAETKRQNVPWSVREAALGMTGKSSISHFPESYRDLWHHQSPVCHFEQLNNPTNNKICIVHIQVLNKDLFRSRQTSINECGAMLIEINCSFFKIN